jgi:hypothetical protein
MLEKKNRGFSMLRNDEMVSSPYIGIKCHN